MRVNDIIRNILDLIDGVDQPDAIPPIATIVEPCDQEQEFEHDDIRRFKQIIDILDNPADGTNSPFSNAPSEVVTDIESVTVDAGGGVNNPKHPSDQRVQHPSLYPAHQDGVK